MKYVFFTGATGGLGVPAVALLAERGWTVFAAGTNEAKLAALAAANVIPVRVDITDMESLMAAKREVLKHTDRLDAIVNFAGVTCFGSLIENDPQLVVERTLSINVLGMVQTNAVFFELVEKSRGRIVNCSSSAGWMTAQPFAGAYTTSKRAVEGYNDSLRREVMSLGVRVIKIQPGSYRTELTSDVECGFDAELARTVRYGRLLTKMKPLLDSTLRRSGRPQDLAAVVVRALEAKRPRLRYRRGSDILLLLLELLPEAWIDAIYRRLYK